MKFRNILLVEDNEIDAYITKFILQKSNIVENIIHKINGVEAVKYLTEEALTFPEIILLDIRMPEMDGFGFLDQMEMMNHPEKNICRVFMLSSSNDTNDIEKAKTYINVVDYMFKPFNPNYIQLLG